MTPTRTGNAPAFLIDAETLRVEAARRRLLTDLAIAQAIGIPPSILSRVLAGQQRPSNELLARIAVYFGSRGYARIVKLGEYIA